MTVVQLAPRWPPARLCRLDAATDPLVKRTGVGLDSFRIDEKKPPTGPIPKRNDEEPGLSRVMPRSERCPMGLGS